MGGWQRDGWGTHMGGTLEWIGLLMMLLWSILLLLAIIALVVWMLRFARGQDGRGSQPPARGASGGGGAAMSILEERFARGEIDEEQFQRMRRTLAGG
jgi:putative membrane protein